MSNHRKLTAARLDPLVVSQCNSLAFAQKANLQAAAVRKNVDDCFYSSVAEQLKSSRITDYNILSENVFQASSTERAIGVVLTANNVEMQTVATLLIKIRLDLKKFVSDIAANPNRYLK
jgi:hypothetical protein